MMLQSYSPAATTHPMYDKKSKLQMKLATSSHIRTDTTSNSCLRSKAVATTLQCNASWNGMTPPTSLIDPGMATSPLMRQPMRTSEHGSMHYTGWQQRWISPIYGKITVKEFQKTYYVIWMHNAATVSLIWKALTQQHDLATWLWSNHLWGERNRAKNEGNTKLGTGGMFWKGNYDLIFTSFKLN